MVFSAAFPKHMALLPPLYQFGKRLLLLCLVFIIPNAVICTILLPTLLAKPVQHPCRINDYIETF
jgi:hypothetical protein